MNKAVLAFLPLQTPLEQEKSCVTRAGERKFSGLQASLLNELFWKTLVPFLISLVLLWEQVLISVPAHPF